MPNRPFQAVESFQYAKGHLFERNSVVLEHELMKEALRHGPACVDLGQLRVTPAGEQADGAILRSRNEVATRESLHLEKHIIALVNRGMGREERLGGGYRYEPSDHLRAEQSKAVERILDSQDFAINLRGAVGIGKTATLKEIDRDLHDAGHGVVTVAPKTDAGSIRSLKGRR